MASKGIPESIWQTTEPEDWEERLAEYEENMDFAGAKNDTHPEVFPLYLKIENSMWDKDFDTLDKYEKEEFLLGKIKDLTDKQLNYAIKNIKGYYNSLDFDDKVIAAAKTNDHDRIVKLIQDPNFTGDNYNDSLDYATNPDEILELIIQNKKDLTDRNVSQLLSSATNRDEMAKLIIQKKENLTDKNFIDLLDYATNKDKIAELIIQKKEDLTNWDVYCLLGYATKPDELAQLLGSENINKLSDENVEDLLDTAPKKDQIRPVLQKYGRIQ